MDKTRLILVGGFLGSGKTTLLFEATQMLQNEGKIVGLITNDQAPELVDTALLSQTSRYVSEVSGSCFCCNFNGFIQSVKSIRKEIKPDIIIAEPVGSCTDLSATIVQPLKEIYSSELQVSPLTVMADPQRLNAILDGQTSGLHPSAAYIYRKQLEEGDIILISKTDLLPENELKLIIEKAKLAFPDALVLPVSAKTGRGIADWLQLVFSERQSGRKIIDVDYDVYAEGEAVMGWLNASVSFHGKSTDWNKFAGAFLGLLNEKTNAVGIETGHTKIILENGSQFLVGNITGTSGTFSIQGNAGSSNESKMIINARVNASPEILEQLVKDVLNKLTIKDLSIKISQWNCLSPGYPKPSFRYDKVVYAGNR